MADAALAPTSSTERASSSLDQEVHKSCQLPAAVGAEQGIVRNCSSALLQSPELDNCTRLGQLGNKSGASSSVCESTEAGSEVQLSCITAATIEHTQNQEVKRGAEYTGTSEIAAKDAIIGQLAAEVAALADAGARAAVLEVRLTEAKDSNKALKHKVEVMAATLAALEGQQQEQQEWEQRQVVFGQQMSHEGGWPIGAASSSQGWLAGGVSRPCSSGFRRNSSSLAGAGIDGLHSEREGGWPEPWASTGPTGGGNSGRFAEVGTSSHSGPQVGA
jgi:hypothetical protein